MKLQDETLKILSECSIIDNTIYLPDIQLDRKSYLTVNKHLENLGGKWNRKAKGHVFDDDPSDSFENMLLTGETTDFKKEFQFFETPLDLAQKIISMAEINKEVNILEPSAGRGALLKGIDNLPYGSMIFAVEINSKNCKVLIDQGFGIVINDDFLSVDLKEHCEDSFDRVLMNPPFTKQLDVDHILHAYSLLQEGGILVSVVSESPFFRENKKSIVFREFLDSNDAEVIINPEGAFKASGTMVRTRLIKIVKN